MEYLITGRDTALTLHARVLTQMAFLRLNPAVLPHVGVCSSIFVTGGILMRVSIQGEGVVKPDRRARDLATGAVVRRREPFTVCRRHSP